LNTAFALYGGRHGRLTRLLTSFPIRPMGTSTSTPYPFQQYMRITGCTVDQADAIDEIMRDVIPNFPDMEEVRRLPYEEQVKIAYEAVLSESEEE
jgi:hypothetical protein